MNRSEAPMESPADDGRDSKRIRHLIRRVIYFTNIPVSQ